MFLQIRNCFLILFIGLLSAFSSFDRDRGKSYDSASFVIDPENKIFFLGEIKGVSYIKLTLVKVDEQTTYANSSILKYKGSYYESVSGKTYALIGTFDSESRDWTLKSFDLNNAIFGTFTGKQNWDGDISGYWKCKNKTYSFYLKLQERKTY